MGARRFLKRVLVVSVGFLGLVAAPSAHAEPVLDANCPGDPPYGFGGGSGDGFAAQTFTAQSSGRLTTAQPIVFKSGTPGDWIVQINAADSLDAPSNTVLASVTIPDAAVPAGAATLTAEFPAPAEVTAGQPYALVMTRPGSSSVGVSTRSGNPCPGGYFRRAASESSPWGPSGGPSMPDVVFATYVDSAVADEHPPETTITKRPKDKTKKKTATFEFSGTDTRAIASFQCSLDGAVFTSCTSPYSVKVKKGKHTFSVRAVDQAGNVGTPASDDWKRKKKRKS